MDGLAIIRIDICGVYSLIWPGCRAKCLSWSRANRNYHLTSWDTQSAWTRTRSRSAYCFWDNSSLSAEMLQEEVELGQRHWQADEDRGKMSSWFFRCVFLGLSRRSPLARRVLTLCDLLALSCRQKRNWARCSVEWTELWQSTSCGALCFDVSQQVHVHTSDRSTWWYFVFLVLVCLRRYQKFRDYPLRTTTHIYPTQFISHMMTQSSMDLTVNSYPLWPTPH